MNETLTRVAVANYSKLPQRAGYKVTVGEHEVAIFKVTNGNVYAVENRSPHPKGGVLSEGLVSGEYVFCPVYDWKISLVDGKVQAPDEGQVQTFPVEVEGDTIYLLV